MQRTLSVKFETLYPQLGFLKCVLMLTLITFLLKGTVKEK